MQRTSIFPILLVNFIGTLGFSIVIPFLVVLVTKWGGNAFVYGLVGATYSAFQLIGAPILGKWSDQMGRKKILLLSQAGTAVAWGVFLIAFFVPDTLLYSQEILGLGMLVITLPIAVLFGARALDGITGGNVSVANAYVADISTEEDRNKNFGRMGVSANLGFILGPALAGVLGSTALEEMLVVIVALAVSTIAIFVIAFGLKESQPKPVDKRHDSHVGDVLGCDRKECHKIESKDEQSKQTIKLADVWKRDNIAYLLVMTFVIFLAFNFFYTAFPVHAITTLGWSVGSMGTFFAVMAACMVVVQGPVLSRLSKKCSEKWLVMAGSVILGINFVMLLSANTIVLYGAVVLFAIGNGIMWPSFLSIVSNVAGDTYQGAVQGFTSSAGSLASIVGLIAGGVLYVSFGAFTFILSAIAIGIVFVMSLKLMRLDV